MLKKLSLILFVIFLTTILFAKDVEINILREDYEGEEVQKSEIRLYISGEKVKIMGEGNRYHFIFHGNKDAIWIVDTEKKVYMELNKDLINRTASMRDKAMAKMEKRLAQMPKAQRKMARKMMEQQMEKYNKSKFQQEAEKFSYKSTSITKKINDYPCKRVDVYNDTVKVEELWITDWNNIKYKEDIETAYTSMMNFVDSLKTTFQSQQYNNALRMPFMLRCQLDDEDKLDGYPVSAINYDEYDNVTNKIYLENIESKKLPASTFSPPEDYILKKPDISQQ